MININQKRGSIRVGTSLLATVSHNTDIVNKVVYIENISAIGAKIISRDYDVNLGDTMNIRFRYKQTLYRLQCQVVRIDTKEQCFGVKFNYNDDTMLDCNSTTDANSNKANLYSDIINEYFLA